MTDFIIAGTQETPFSCRWTEFGKKVFVRGKKKQGIIVGCLPDANTNTNNTDANANVNTNPNTNNKTNTNSLPPSSSVARWVEALCCNQISVRSGPLLQCTLGTELMICHGFALAEMCREVTAGGRQLRKGDLLFYGERERLERCNVDAAADEWATVVREWIRESEKHGHGEDVRKTKLVFERPQKICEQQGIPNRSISFQY
jgi:hypothetical protein